MNFLKQIGLGVFAMLACSAINAQRFSSDGICYEFSDSGDAKVVLADTFYSGFVRIPAEVNGAKVTAIGFGITTLRLLQIISRRRKQAS